jgi:hypothetical protein
MKRKKRYNVGTITMIRWTSTDILINESMGKTGLYKTRSHTQSNDLTGGPPELVQHFRLYIL